MVLSMCVVGHEGRGKHVGCMLAFAWPIVALHKELAMLVAPGRDMESRRGRISSTVCSSLYMLIFMALCINHFF